MKNDCIVVMIINVLLKRKTAICADAKCVDVMNFHFVVIFSFVDTYNFHVIASDLKGEPC